MKTINLTKGAVAIVDDEDFEEVSKHKWTLQSHGYARTFVGRDVIYLHRFVMNADSSQEVDHIDMNKLNCSKSNLRFCSRSQNSANKTQRSTNETGYKGVRWDESRGKFLARIGINKRTINLGRYKTAEEAAKAYNKAAKDYYGDFARLNDV